jgi:sialic acid synthase SpsE
LDKFLIAGREISQALPPYVIADLSANHNGSIERVLEIIQKCKSAGADVVKIQTYTPDTITLNCSAPEFVLDGGLWDGRNLYDLYAEAHMPWDWHKVLFDLAKKINLTIFSSSFYNTAIDLLENLNAPAADG